VAVGGDAIDVKGQASLPEPIQAHGTSLSKLRRRPQPRYWPLLASAAALGVLVGVLALALKPRHVTPTAKVVQEAPPAPQPVVAPLPPPKPPEPEVGIVKIETAPAGAALYLDGVKLPSL